MEIVSNFHADAALTLRKKRGFSVCSVAGSRYCDYPSNPHFQCGIALSPGRKFGILMTVPLLSSSLAGLRANFLLDEQRKEEQSIGVQQLVADHV